MKYGSIVPLIGGQTMGMEAAYGGKPEYFLSFDGFQGNDIHAREYYKDTPYYIIGTDKVPQLEQVDVLSTTCPCAGLSSLSTSSNSNSPTNDWMLESAKYALEVIKPEVFWGENAPRLASAMGRPVVDKLRAIAKENGYTFSLMKTKTLLHGLPQVRDRSFYFFWKGEHCPVFDLEHKPRKRIEDLIRSASPCDILTNKKIPSEDPLYRFVLDEIGGGKSHPEFVESCKDMDRSKTAYELVEDAGISYLDVAKWMRSQGHEKKAERFDVVYEKLKAGKNIMRHGVMIPIDYTGAFVGHIPMSMTHPDIDRHLSLREALDMMGMPQDFELQGGIKNLNHICQNVPVTTARDMAQQIDKYLSGDLERVKTDFLIQNNKKQEVEYIETKQQTLFT